MPVTECASSVRIRTDTTLEEGLFTEGNCAGMYSVHARVLVDNMYEFQHFSSRAGCTFFDARFASQTRKYHWTQKLSMHVCQLILVCTTLCFQAWSNCILTIPECQSDHHGSFTNTAWSRQSVCSLCHPRTTLGS